MQYYSSYNRPSLTLLTVYDLVPMSPAQKDQVLQKGYAFRLSPHTV
jgi:hypothetical protein